jgi:hypothetical protein
MNENHKRVLAIYLHNIERNLEKIKRELGHDTSKSEPVLTIVNCDLNEYTKTELMHCSSIMLDEIRLINDQYEFQPQNESSKKRINGALTEIWTTINDLRPKNLENYGSLAAGDMEMLDTMVSRLLVILNEMYSSLD